MLRQPIRYTRSDSSSSGGQQRTIGKKKKKTALHQAKYNKINHSFSLKGLLQHLLRNKASVRALDEQKRTPLHWAAQHSSPEMALLLLQHQAAVDPLDQDGRTPLLLGKSFLRKNEGKDLLYFYY